jgi:DNA-binding NarL/FixJ family response regulator
VMKLFLPVATGGTAFVFDAGSLDFTERDRSVLEELAPHLTQLHRRASTHRPLATETAAMSVLTPRERQVLRLVAAGLSNREVAAALYLAPGTVRKHLENIYAKLDVRNRTAAVSVSFGQPAGTAQLLRPRRGRPRTPRRARGRR